MKTLVTCDRFVRNGRQLSAVHFLEHLLAKPRVFLIDQADGLGLGKSCSNLGSDGRAPLCFRRWRPAGSGATGNRRCASLASLGFGLLFFVLSAGLFFVIALGIRIVVAFGTSIGQFFVLGLCLG